MANFKCINLFVSKGLYVSVTVVSWLFLYRHCNAFFSLLTKALFTQARPAHFIKLACFAGPVYYFVHMKQSNQLLPAAGMKIQCNSFLQAWTTAGITITILSFCTSPAACQSCWQHKYICTYWQWHSFCYFQTSAVIFQRSIILVEIVGISTI